MSKPAQLTAFGYALAGALGGCFSNALIYPLDTVKTRIQAATADGTSADKLSIVGVLSRILREDGFTGYYRGFTATMLNTFSMQYAYFFFYSFVRTSYLKRLAARRPAGSPPPVLGTAAELVLGALAGALAQIFTIPVSVIATRQQIGRSFDRPKRVSSSAKGKGKATAEDAEEEAEEAEEPYDDSFLGVAREIIAEEGVGGLWLGIRPGLVLTVNPAITYGMFERVKSLTLAARGVADPNARMSPGMSFMVGALSKALATVVTYPYIMAKVRIQARTADIEDAEVAHEPLPKHNAPHHKKHAHVGALTVLARVYRKKGLVGWYQGMSAQLIKAVITQALLFMSKDQFEKYALAIMIMFYRLQGAAP
ncbi:adenine nucleotide transporter [Epithele typhae]|uniref:adenine nucleotide transporter n=1 Tax=Epithele typhae TaxID=378194 RepID=UPI002007E857|nr:adenine nucleotide transporter [Epithele typhae]KAH9945076.1 adenine nucleotide transporter [Epithele typhae]